MRLVVTGGGTGGHIYPALEVARHARAQGDELLYLGSIRGQERALCAQDQILFQGFPAQPLYSLKTPRGWRAAALLLRSVWMARKALKVARPDVVFSTGGYSAAPIVAASKRLRIPYVLFEANSIPGRTHRMFANHAAAFACVFHKTQSVLSGVRIERTGMPIRASLREAATSLERSERKLVVIGGSQGSAFLNRLVPEIASRLPDLHIVHAVGRNNHDEAKSRSLRAGYRQVPYLELDDLIDAYRTSTVALARSGGTVAEFALFRLPSVLVPLPTSADSHQLHNAREFADMDAATVIEERLASPDAVAQAIALWCSDIARRKHAEGALAGWDVPDATARIYRLIAGAKLSQSSSSARQE